MFTLEERQKAVDLFIELGQKENDSSSNAVKLCYICRFTTIQLLSDIRMCPMKLNPKYISSVSKITFSIGGFFDGFETRTVLLDGESPRMIVTHSFCLDEKEREVSLSMGKEAFLNCVRELHIEGWKSKYIAPDILDGTQWDLEIYFSDGHRSVKIAGNNAYPDNFAELEKLFKCCVDNQGYRVFKGQLHSLQLVSDDFGYGPMPELDEEVEQRLTVCRDGRI